MTSVELFSALVAGHIIADYQFQGDFLSKAKNRAAPIPGVPWYQALGTHAIIHGFFVWLLTGSAVLGLAEVFAHAAIDDTKCQGRISFNTDQALHIICKIVWVAWSWLP